MSSSLSDYFSKGELRLRKAQDSDIKTLVALINEAYSYQDEVKGEPRTNPHHLHNRIAETDFYVVTYNEEIIGCIYLDTRGSALHFGLLTLIPKYRGKGIAKSLIEAIDTYAQENGLTTIDLDYLSLAPWLKTYYERYGFTETGDTIQWGDIDLVHMSKRVG